MIFSPEAVNVTSDAACAIESVATPAVREDRIAIIPQVANFE
jgi:hypothetical protein